MALAFYFFHLYPCVALFEFINENIYYLCKMKNIKEIEVGVLQMLEIKRLLLVPT